MEATILYGNGLNLISQPQKTWTKLLKELFDKYGNDLIPDHKPYPMVYEELFLRNELLKLEDEKEVKSEVVKFVKQNKINEFYKMLSEFGLQNYLTTNYDFTLEEQFKKDGYAWKYNGKETKYSIFTYMEIEGTNTKVWHIHGNAIKENTIQLGFDQYCAATRKVIAYTIGELEFENQKINRITNKLKKDQYDTLSWIELFFTTDIHIIGLSMDYSETDLWWLLERRARYIKGKSVNSNNIYYYDILSQDSKSKEQLLTAFGVEYLPFKNENKEDWRDVYKTIFEKLKTNIKERHPDM